MPIVLEEENHYEATEDATDALHVISEIKDESGETARENIISYGNADLHPRQEEKRKFTIQQGKLLTLDLLFSENSDTPFKFNSAQEEYMHWHIKLGHLSHKRIQQLAT